jgi:hypothetical protein
MSTWSTQFDEIGRGNNCPKCGNPMNRRERTTPPDRDIFWHTQWDVCVNYICRKVVFYDEYRRFGPQGIPAPDLGLAATGTMGDDGRSAAGS